MSPQVEAIVKPELLVWARKTSRLDLATAAKKLKISVERLEGWESGKQKLTVPQLRKLATIYKRPIAVFYLPDVPVTFDALHDFRKLPDGNTRSISPELALEIRKASQRREIALELLSDTEETAVGLQIRISITNNPDKAADQIRDFLGISLQDQYRWIDQYDALNSWKGAIEKAGVLVFQSMRVPVEDMRGMSINEKILPVVVLNGQDAPRAKIFSLLHEFTHLAIENGGICDLRESQLPIFEDSSEVYCNRVAGAVLVPAIALKQESIVRERRSDSDWTDLDIAALADRYWVSDEAMLRRLAITGSVSDAFYRQKREEYIKRYSELKKQRKTQKAGGGYAPHYRMVIRNNGTRYTRLVLDAYYEESITASQLSDFLEVKLKHLDAITQAVYYSRGG